MEAAGLVYEGNARASLTVRSPTRVKITAKLVKLIIH